MEDHLDPFSRSTAANESHDQEESLSLRDLPLTPPHSSTAVDPPPPASHSRRSSASDFHFEFLVNHDDCLTSPADDVIFGGRLLPYTPPPPRRSLSLSSACRRSDSLPLTESKPQLISQSTIRPSRSLNCRNSSSKAGLLPQNSSNSCRSCNSDHYKAAVGMKPPWYWLVLGLPARIPVEMELKDIKSRQFRRSISPAGSFSGDRCSSASWRILSVLSCKSHASVDVMKTTPYHI